MEEGLRLENVTIERAGKTILADFSLIVTPGELVHVGGKNGSGKSTLALTIMGHPSCKVTAGAMKFFAHDLLTLAPHERARLGIFLAHQEPPALSGVSVSTAFRAMVEAMSTQELSTAEFYDQLRAALTRVGLADEFIDRGLHEGFSGGEKKRAELAALLMLKPRLAILDEIDAGMDEAAKRMTAEIITELRTRGTAFVVISHNQDFAAAVQPSQVVNL